MSFGQAIITCFSKYATFGGRASRSEYWFFALFLIIIAVASGLMEVVAATRGVSEITFLVLLLPSLAVFVRRLHDVDRSGWWALPPFVPIIILSIMVAPTTPSIMLEPASDQAAVVWRWLPVSLLVLVTLVIWIFVLVCVGILIGSFLGGEFIGPPDEGYLGPAESPLFAGPQHLDIWPVLAASLVALATLIIWIVLMVWACARGTSGPNRHGRDPFAR